MTELTDRLFKRQIGRAFLPLRTKDRRYKGSWGGRGGGKSHFFAEQMIEDCVLERGLPCVCLREIQKTLAQSSKRLIETKLIKFGLGEAQGFKVFREVIEAPGDGVIIFNGMQDHNAESVKSLEGFKRAWWEEAQTATATSLRLLRPTLRAADSELWFGWNPKNPPDAEHPLDSVDGLFRLNDPTTLPGGGVCVEAHFSLNPWFKDLPLVEEENYDWLHRDIEDYRHIWDGKYQSRSEARVFKNWIKAPFITPANATFRFGADFGFSIDPTVLVRMFIGRWLNNDPSTGIAIADDTARTLFIDRESYRVGCDIDYTPALFAGSDRQQPPRWKNPFGDIGIDGSLDWPIVADSARPESISYLQRHGFHKMIAAKKGAGSVEDGIEFLKAYDIVIHDDCPHSIDEFTYYSFATDKLTGAVLPKLEDKKNHVIDAIRYAVEDVRRAKGFFG